MFFKLHNILLFLIEVAKILRKRTQTKSSLFRASTGIGKVCNEERESLALYLRNVLFIVKCCNLDRTYRYWYT